MKIRIIGGGLAGSEAALTAARLGCEVDLYEMRSIVDGSPRLTPAHQTTDLAELVCSNSLKSESENTAPWLLKQEMRRGHSALLRIADEVAVPAGHALAVDRVQFSRLVTEAVAAQPRIRLIREEVTTLDPNEDSTKYCCTILATGPLTSDALAREIERVTGQGRLAFYDSISPIVETDSIDMDRVYMAARWDKGDPDYLNCPMNREEYDRFLDALLAAEPAEAKDWEKEEYFEGCLPIEVLARRGRDTLRFGPMKPVGLRHPRTGQTPWAVVQLRKENLRADSYNLVGFQNHLKWADQARVLRLIPGLENARFLRYGQIHRNTYIQAPLLLDESLSLKIAASAAGDAPPGSAIPTSPTDSIPTEGAPGPSPLGTWESTEATGFAGSANALGAPSFSAHLAEKGGKALPPPLPGAPGLASETGESAKAPVSRILFAGQLSGIEGYTESIATGLLAGLYAAQLVRGLAPVPVPRPTALGSLVHYITHAEARHFQPANMTFDLLVPLEEELRKKIRDKKERHRLQCERSLAAFDAWWAETSSRLQ